MFFRAWTIYIGSEYPPKILFAIFFYIEISIALGAVHPLGTTKQKEKFKA